MRVLVVASSLLYRSPAVALREGLRGVGALCDNGERSACTSKEREGERGETVVGYVFYAVDLISRTSTYCYNVTSPQSRLPSMLDNFTDKLAIPHKAPHLLRQRSLLAVILICSRR